MRINTEIDTIIVEIDGEEYPVAEKTVAVADALDAAAKKCVGKPEYLLWKAQLEVLLGKEAVKRLFASGQNENIDRMERIYQGVLQAFEANSKALEAELMNDKADVLAGISRSLAPLTELLKQVARMSTADDRKIINRPDLKIVH